MDVFALRNRVVADYKSYIESFVRIRDGQIDQFVRDKFASGALWPDPILQLNPAYESGGTLDELANLGIVQPGTAKYFRKFDGGPLRLYSHQREAIEVAKRGGPYVVTTGTGSGKSLTYLIPIYDHILRNNPEKAGVRAIIVYPMNALINSQELSLRAYEAGYPENLVRVERYTGQEKPEVRQRIQDNPPHILLTNYVMLEYMLLRPAERKFTDAATANLEFIVLDELHTYRGRQGADVAMLLRRLRERSKNQKLLHIGTSATMSTEGSRDARRVEVAKVATKLFGSEVTPESIIDETLRRAIAAPAPTDGASLRIAVEQAIPTSNSGFVHHSLAAWAENCFGLAEEDDRLVRKVPITFQEGVKELSDASGLPREQCEAKLRELLAAGNEMKTESGDPLFAFRLHQFLAAGGTVYATLEPADKRQFSMEGRYYAGSGEEEKLLYPLVFCRECGQEYYMVNLGENLSQQLLPRAPIFSGDDSDSNVIPGYVALNRDAENEADLWNETRESDLPDNWWEQRAKGPRIKKDFKPHLPRELKAKTDGAANAGAGTKVWFQPSPFLLCLRCGAAYDRREKNDFRKLTRLSHTGRSTATTLVSGSAIVQLRADGDVDEKARKLLSFTDNRQDASLQAGHFNDFIQVALIRSALHKALSKSGSLDHAMVTPAVFSALGLKQEAYAKEPSDADPGKSRNEKAMMRLLEYRLYEDLRRGWRVIQPNLEQCGLLEIEYPGLKELCENDALWDVHPVLQQASPECRYRAIHSFLDHLRREMAIDIGVLDPAEEWDLRQRVTQNLRDPWAFDNEDVLRQSCLFVLPGATGAEGIRDRSLAGQSKLSRFLRSRHTWNIPADITPGEWEQFIHALVKVLRGNFILLTKTHTKKPAIQLQASSFRWKQGTGTPPHADPIRTRWMRTQKDEAEERKGNAFFASLYKVTARMMAGIEGGAHTGQIPPDVREAREEKFRNGSLSALFCSPTMELGIDIRDLNVVHMRNVPPTPANYAQRSGRAGRGGQPALVVAFCSEGSPHDQYFFRQPELMVSGVVAPPRLELSNEELIRAHMHSTWVSATGITLRSGMADVLDLSQPGFPLNADIQHAINLSPEKSAQLLQEGRAILSACGEEVIESGWYGPNWLELTFEEAPARFNAAFDRWRELYASAVRQRDQARVVVDRPTASNDERKKAKGQVAEAEREVDLLLNRTNQPTESDFYPYRYLASEGFLPGYNFPRLPLRALLEGEATYMVDRPRFLGLSEFGPRNILYHEGRKYRMSRCVLPTGGIESRLKKAKFCLMCGYFHEDTASAADVCDHCKTTFNGETSQFVPTLFEMTTVRGNRVERITCDEEERTREGYEIATHYRFASGPDGQAIVEKAITSNEGGLALCDLAMGSQADLWRVNRRWRRSEQKGFTLDKNTGFWSKKPGEEGPNDVEGKQLATGVQPFVRDTRNLLLVKPQIPSTVEDKESFLASASFALQRGMQILFQVEEQEIAVSRIGEKDERRILFWEAAEGGNGVWARLLEDPNTMATVARQALSICHFDPNTGDDLIKDESCSHACYRCLLSYSNQTDHPRLDRFVIRDYLLSLMGGVTARHAKGRTYEAQYEWLQEKRDPNSSLESEFLSVLFASKHRLPDRAQYRPEEGVYCEADFFYEREGLKGIAVFIDGPHHDEPLRQQKDKEERHKLENCGYRVIVIRYNKTLPLQVLEHSDVFGPGMHRPVPVAAGS